MPTQLEDPLPLLAKSLSMRSTTLPRRISHFLPLCLLLLSLLTPACANAGTMLMQLGMYQLLGINLLIAAFEAWVAGRFLARRYGLEVRLFGWMVLANYLSMFAGWLGLAWFVNKLEPVVLGTHPVANLPWLVAATYLLAFALSVTLEWLVLHLGVRRALAAYPPPAPLPTITFRANLLAQCASYAILVPLYLLASGTTLLTSVKRERTLDFVKTPQAMVYYQSVAGQGYYQRRLDGSAPRRVAMSAEDVYAKAAQYYGMDTDRVLRDWQHGRAIDLRPRNQRAPEVFLGFWPVEGLSVHNKTERYSIAMEMPHFFWWPKSATVLPGDQVVYQVKDYLVVFDTHTRQIADLGPGHAPVVFIPGVKYQPDEP